MANYKDAGVDVEAGYEAVRLMKEHVGKTFRKEVLTGLGGFGSLFELDLSRYEQPVLISGTDGVGTKLKISFLTDRYDTVGTVSYTHLLKGPRATMRTTSWKKLPMKDTAPPASRSLWKRLLTTETERQPTFAIFSINSAEISVLRAACRLCLTRRA